MLMESQNPQLPISVARDKQLNNDTPSLPTSPDHDVPRNNIVLKLKTNLAIQSIWGELNGAMGDLGTYIPIVLVLTLAKDLNLGTTLIFTGFYDFMSGSIYGIPVPVQPMKSILSVAISQQSSFGIEEIMAAGFCTGVIMLILGALGLIKLLHKLIPHSIVRGIQLSQGLSFAVIAVEYIRKTQDFSKSKMFRSEDRRWVGFDGMILAIVCACFIIIVDGAGDDKSYQTVETRRKRLVGKLITSLPSAFLILLLGVILAFIRQPKVVRAIKFGPSPILVMKISKHAWKQGFIKGTVPQLPLTILNSVIAVSKMSSDLFPEKKKLSVTSLSVTVGLMNVVGCWFGAMPCCHGVGGLAGHYKFGGRSGGCLALLGATKLALGLIFGSSFVEVLREFPVGVLGVMLMFAAIELAMASRDMNSKEETFVMLICTAISLATSATIGFGCGVVVHLLLKVRNLVARDQSWSTIWTKEMAKQIVTNK